MIPFIRREGIALLDLLVYTPEEATRDAQRWIDKAVQSNTKRPCRSFDQRRSKEHHCLPHATSSRKLSESSSRTGRYGPPKTHELPQIVALIPGLAPSPSVSAAAAMTSTHDWSTRYPGGVNAEYRPYAFPRTTPVTSARK